MFAESKILGDNTQQDPSEYAKIQYIWQNYTLDMEQWGAEKQCNFSKSLLIMRSAATRFVL